MAKLRVGVLRGGPSAEYDVSLKTGAEVLKHLDRSKYEPMDIFLTRDGAWHSLGLPISPNEAANNVELFFNCLHGEFGEDGGVQNLLTNLGRPFTGAEELSAMAAMNKPTTKSMLSRAGFLTPSAVLVTPRASARASARLPFEKLSPPWVIKPVDRGSSFGLSFARSFDELAMAIEHAAQYSPQVLVEQYIPGKEVSLAVIENFRGQEVYPLLPVEIRKPANKSVWHYEDRYSAETAKICPAPLSEVEKTELARLAVLAHELLGLRHYSQADFVVSPRGIYLLEVNSLPGLTSESLLPKALSAVGCSFSHFLDHVINLARTWLNSYGSPSLSV